MNTLDFKKILESRKRVNVKHPDIFEKCRRFEAAEAARQLGYYPYYIPIDQNDGPVAIIDGKEMIMCGSNNYLGLTTHPEVKEAAIEAIKKYGTSNTGSRFLNGTLKLHHELEEELADFVKKEKAIVFSTGFQVNLGTISAIVSRDDWVIIDKLDHASIIDGCILSGGVLKRFRHNDTDDLEKLLKKAPDDVGKLVVVDGIFSMEGDIARLDAIVDVCKRYGARLMVDDAHSIGVLGDHGRGTANHFGLDDEVDLIMGTFSKSFASLGGFVAGSKEVIDFIKHHARSLIFSASMPASNLASVKAALKIMREDAGLVEKLWENVRYIKQGFVQLGFDTGESETPIIPIIIGDEAKTLLFWKDLFDAGVYVNPVLSPAVPPNRALLRTSYMATHKKEQLDKVLEEFEKIGKKYGVI